MGSVTNAQVDAVGEYGILALRYNGLRSFTRCMIDKMNSGKPVRECNP